VGKSSLINALVGRRVARTSAAPGKTRLANVYRVVRGHAAPFYLVDLPGFGYARGNREALAAVTSAYFERVRLEAGTRVRLRRAAAMAVLLLVDARHPALASDLAAWTWLKDTGATPAIVATKIDTLSRAARLRALKVNDAAFEHPVLPVSADTGEGLEALWKLIDRLKTSG
jgi:GTP-binding protein